VPLREWRVRVNDMIVAAERALGYVGGLTFEQFAADPRTSVSPSVRQPRSRGTRTQYPPATASGIRVIRNDRPSTRTVTWRGVEPPRPLGPLCRLDVM
jgi:hypothetical protein